MADSEKIQELNDQNFEQETRDGTVLVDFWAPWCAPCKMQGQVLENVAEKVDNNVKICKVNVDDAPDTAGKFGVRSIPTLVVLKDGEASEQLVGVQDESTLLRAVGAE